MDVRVINELVHKQSAFIEKLNAEVGKVIVGQKAMVERIMIGLLTGGHVLLEGVPGLAKTLTVKTLADTLAMKFQRIQFTPDLLPADIVGTVIYNQARAEFVSKQGPIFANLVLADEINRAPAKVQSALLEAMQERSVTIGHDSHRLDEPFLVLATQNPVEHEGTFPLPEAQLDRFLFQVRVTYPSRDEELEILSRQVGGLATTSQVEPVVRFGASPRAAVHFVQAARATAALGGRAYVLPEDVKEVAMDVLRHRLILSYDAEADNVSSDEVVGKILAAVPVP